MKSTESCCENDDNPACELSDTLVLTTVLNIRTLFVG